MSKEVQIHIGMRWNHPSVEVICRETERFLSWLTHFEETHLGAKERIPVHWNLPSYPFLELRKRSLDDLVLEIKTRVQSKEDVPVSMGYSGGVHPLLTKSELEKECEWGITNPWNSGIRDTFGKSTQIIIPYSPDIWRSDAVACYAKNEFSFVGINANSKDQLYFNNPKNPGPDTPQFFFFLPLTSQLVIQLKKDVKKVLEENDHILPFFFDCMYIEELVKIPFDFTPFTRILELIMSRYSVRFTTIKTLPVLSQGLDYPYSFDKRDVLPNHPLWRQKAAKIKSDRGLSLKTTTNMKDILKAISPLYLVPPESKNQIGNSKDKNLLNKNNNWTSTNVEGWSKIPVFPPEDRINTADMRGNVTLSGDIFSVQFLGGKIRNFIYKKKKILAGEKMRSYIRIQGLHFDISNSNAFSISGDKCRGLREIRKIILNEDESPGSQLTDYIFVEDFPYLIVTSKITYPYFPVNEYIEQHALFELPLFYLNIKKDEHIHLYVFSDDTRETYTIKPKECAFSLTGNTFVFFKDSVPVIIGFPGGKGPDLQILNVKMVKHKKGISVMVNIGGSYYNVPASLYSRVTEIFSFFLGVCPTPGDEISLFPSQVLNEIPQNTVYKKSD